MANQMAHPAHPLLRDAEGMDDVELVTAVLTPGRPGPAKREVASALLASTGGIAGVGRTGIESLARMPGVGRRRAARLLAALELGRRAVATPLDAGTPIRSSAEVVAAFGPRLRDALEERFYAVPLDARHRPIRIVEVARGGVTACPVAPADVYRHVLGVGAPAVLFVHNHPSGVPSPSREDIVFTERMVAAGRLLGVIVVDHVIVAREGHYSFLDDGRLADRGPDP